ncbi:cyanophycinase [Streptomyces sp. TRM66268-LWL]|uniref:Cyanophycinase n=1 Tax=Streptomyces polyasparticus TaxID=2767826 RepID=A0ABR7SSA5_9ACTN|nr:cyanophycinase [Streptomyces polyasparticus]MBC9718380.1 cyanophycinase [Streptomyces polyasparticus]
MPSAPHPRPHSPSAPRPRAHSRRTFLTLAAGALTAAAATAAPATAANRRTTASATGGTLFLIGGALADTNTQVYGRIVAAAGGSGARFGVLTTGSHPDDAAANGAFYADLLKRHGAGSAEWLPIDAGRPGAAEDAALAAKASGMTGFFLGGGDQYRYATVLKRSDGGDTAVLAAVRARLAAGGVVAGTSAGAQIQAGADMITGGESYEALRDGSSPGWFEDATRLGYLAGGGFGFFSHGLVDTHFAARGRQGRSLRLASDTGHSRFFGIDENTALEVAGVGTGQESLTVLGERAVFVFDLRTAAPRTDNGEWGISAVKYGQLTAGDRYNPYTWGITPASGRAPLVPRDRYARRATDDVFASYVFTDNAGDLALSGRSTRMTDYTYETGPEFAVELRKPSAGYAAWTADGRRPSTLQGMLVDVYAP